MSGLKIVSTGRSVPSKKVTNNDMSEFVETSDEWIKTRTGIANRYFCNENENTTTLAIKSALNAIEKHNINVSDIGICIVASFTPQYLTPSTACLVQSALNLPSDTLCFDLNAACSGFLYSLEVAYGLLKNSPQKYALVIGSEQISSILDFNDRGTCVLFGDGAGAMIVELSEKNIYSSVFGSNGTTKPLKANAKGEDTYLRMDGKAVFRFAVETIPYCIRQISQKENLDIEKIDHIVCHQANSRIIDLAAKKLNLPNEKFYKNMNEYGNTSAASIPIAIDELIQQDKFKLNDKILCVGFGAGLTWGAVLLEY